MKELSKEEKRICILLEKLFLFLIMSVVVCFFKKKSVVVCVLCSFDA